MKTIKEIEKRREVVLEKMRGIRAMERGSINEHYVPGKKKGEPKPVLHGPYHVISRREKNKTVGYHLKGDAELERARREVAAHQYFRELCREYEDLTEELGRLERSLGENTPEKKRRSRRSSGMRR